MLFFQYFGAFMTINFYLDSKLLRSNEKSIICFIRGIKNCKTININTQLKISPEHWNPKNQNVRRSHPDYAQWNSYLDKFKNGVNSAYIEFTKKNFQLETNVIKSFIIDRIFNSPDQHKFDFFEVLDKYIESKSSEFTQGYISNIVSLKKNLLEFQVTSKTVITFENIDLNFYDKFVRYCIQNKEFKNNTIQSKKKHLASFLNWAMQRNYHKNNQYKQFKAKSETIDIVTLTFNELMRLNNLDLEENSIQYHIRNLFCLSCFTGARYSDIMNLKFEDISNNTWHLRTKKTKDIIEIPLIASALVIIEKYKNTNQNFPKIDKNKYNIELKNIAKMAGLDAPVTIVEYKGAVRFESIKPKFELVTSHMGRRTFVTLSLEKGMRPEIVMKITGHKDYKTFKRYIEITDKVKHQEMMKAWN